VSLTRRLFMRAAPAATVAAKETIRVSGFRPGGMASAGIYGSNLPSPNMGPLSIAGKQTVRRFGERPCAPES